MTTVLGREPCRTVHYRIMKRGTKTGLNLSSSVETAMTAIPGKCLKTTMQCSDYQWREEKKKSKVVFFFGQRGKAKHNRNLKIEGILRLSLQCCDY